MIEIKPVYDPYKKAVRKKIDELRRKYGRKSNVDMILKQYERDLSTRNLQMLQSKLFELDTLEAIIDIGEIEREDYGKEFLLNGDIAIECTKLRPKEDLKVIGRLTCVEAKIREFGYFRQVVVTSSGKCIELGRVRVSENNKYFSLRSACEILYDTSKHQDTYVKDTIHAIKKKARQLCKDRRGKIKIVAVEPSPFADLCVLSQEIPKRLKNYRKIDGVLLYGFYNDGRVLKRGFISIVNPNSPYKSDVEATFEKFQVTPACGKYAYTLPIHVNFKKVGEWIDILQLDDGFICIGDSTLGYSIGLSDDSLGTAIRMILSDRTGDKFKLTRSDGLKIEIEI